MDDVVRSGDTSPGGRRDARAGAQVGQHPQEVRAARTGPRPDVAGRQEIGSIYRDPFSGPEPVTVYLVFDVTALDAPSTLEVRDIIVR